MKLQRLLERAIQIQSIPAPTFDEEARAAFLEDRFAANGLIDVSRDEIGNLYGRLEGGSNPPLIITAHLDSVFPVDTPLDAHQEDNRLIGPGIGDNALALSALLELAIDFKEQPLVGDLWLVCNVCEEGLGNLRGMREVVKRFGDGVSGYIVLEGMALGHIYHRGLPVKRYRITARTKGGHSWIHAGRRSAIHTLITIGGSILKIPLPEKPRTILNIGIIKGGTTINTIASKASFDVDLRSEDERQLSILEDQFLKCVEGTYSEDVDLETELVGSRPGGGLPEDHPLVEAAENALESVGEANRTLEAGSTDASIPLSLGLPAVCVGITRGGGAHSMEEFIEIEPIQRGYQSVRNLILAALDLNKPSN